MQKSIDIFFGVCYNAIVFEIDPKPRGSHRSDWILCAAGGIFSFYGYINISGGTR